MKILKYAYVFIALLLSGVMMSCNNSADSNVEKLIKDANQQCPVIYDMGVVNSFDIDKDNKIIIINMEIDDEKFDLSKFKDNSSKLENILRLTLFENMSQADKNLVAGIAAEGYGVRYALKGFKSHEIVNVELSNAKLKANKPLSIDENVKANVDFAKISLPQQLDSVTTMTDVNINKDTVIYIYEIDEKNCSMSTLDSKVRGNIVYGINQQFINKSAAGDFFRNVCKSGRGLCYRYKGNESGKVIDIYFDNVTLRQMAIDNQ